MVCSVADYSWLRLIVVIFLNQKSSLTILFTLTWAVTEINPVIHENGMVEVKARISNKGNLLDGMQVKVSVKKSVPGQLVVPKEAVVLRQNQEVLFRSMAII